MALFDELGISYKHDKKTAWSGKKRYDFIIEDYNMIVETHGEQHYRQSLFFIGKRSRTLAEEQRNDEYKRHLAISNGIQTYIELDCSKPYASDIIYAIRQSALPTIFDLSKVDWDSVIKKSLSSIMMNVCDAYNNGCKSITALSNQFGLDKETVTNYLTECSLANLCDYERGRGNRRAVICLETQSVYNSISETEKDGFQPKDVAACCRGEQKTSRGYNWCFLDDYNNGDYVLHGKPKNAKKQIMCVETGKVYNRLIDVRDDGFAPSSVSMCCNGTREKTHGKHFIFIGDKSLKRKVI